LHSEYAKKLRRSQSDAKRESFDRPLLLFTVAKREVTTFEKFGARAAGAHRLCQGSVLRASPEQDSALDLRVSAAGSVSIARAAIAGLHSRYDGARRQQAYCRRRVGQQGFLKL
jgi:hypothetical protein